MSMRMREKVQIDHTLGYLDEEQNEEFTKIPQTRHNTIMNPEFVSVSENRVLEDSEILSGSGRPRRYILPEQVNNTIQATGWHEYTEEGNAINNGEALGSVPLLDPLTTPGSPSSVAPTYDASKRPAYSATDFHNYQALTIAKKKRRLEALFVSLNFESAFLKVMRAATSPRDDVVNYCLVTLYRSTYNDQPLEIRDKEMTWMYLGASTHVYSLKTLKSTEQKLENICDQMHQQQTSSEQAINAALDTASNLSAEGNKMIAQLTSDISVFQDLTTPAQAQNQSTFPMGLQPPVPILSSFLGGILSFRHDENLGVIASMEPGPSKDLLPFIRNFLTPLKVLYQINPACLANKDITLAYNFYRQNPAKWSLNEMVHVYNQCMKL